MKNTVFFRNLSEDSSAAASADAPAIINNKKLGTGEGLPVDAKRMENTTWASGKCGFDKDEKCVIHGVKATVYFVTSKTWTYLNNRKSYGWKARKVKKLACRMKNSGPLDSLESANTTINPGTLTDGKYSGWVENIEDRGLLSFLNDVSSVKRSDVGD